MLDDEHPRHGPRGHHGPPWGRHWRAMGMPGPAGPPWRGPMVRRGDVRSAILALLGETPMHGYQVIQELAERSGGRWRPSAGSVYPTLQQLEDEGLVRSEERDGRRVFALTEAGREAVASGPSRPAAPWDVARGVDEAVALRDLSVQVGAAAMQVAQVGTPATIARAEQMLSETRRRLYQLLAEEGPRPTGASEPPTGGPQPEG